MAVPISLTNLVNLQNETTAVNAINGNNAVITSALTTALSTTGNPPNQMESSLDMNSNQIINLPSPSTPNSPVRLTDINSTITPTPAIVSGSNVYTGNNTFSGTTTFSHGVFSNKPWVDITAFGADSTGVLDSTGAIQSAINSLSTTGGKVFVPQGVFKVSSPINITTSGLVLVGDGKYNSNLKTTSTSGNILNITAAVGVEVDSLIFQGPQTVCTAGSAININNCQGCKLTNLLITDLFTGINLNASTNTLVEFIKIEDIYGPYGIASTNGGGDYIINNQLDMQFLGNYTSTSGYNAWATSTSYPINSVVSTSTGWFIAGVGGVSASSGTGPAITKFNTLVTDGTVQWFFMTAVQSAGILMSNSFSNYINFNDISGPWAVGIYITNGDGNLIQGNVIGQNLTLGIQLDPNATRTLIDGNTINAIFAVNGSAVADTSGSAAGTKIVNNYIQQTGRAAIVFSSPNFIINSNSITTAGLVTSTYAIQVGAGTTQFVINGNQITQGAAGQLGPVQVAAGGSDFYVIANNIFNGQTVSDGGTGTNKTLAGNH